MKNIVLSERLKTAADYLEQGAAVADIGTDHGYIPVYLAQRKLARRIIAADVKEGPLQHARSSAEEYGVSGQIEFIQTDGLDGLHALGLDTVVIAGMGGETIAGILARAPWIKTDNIRLILQPQSKLQELLRFLAENGYSLRDASLAFDEGRIYTILLAGAGKNGAPDAFLRLLADKRDPVLGAYLAERIDKERRAVAGLERSQRHDNDLTEKRSELEKLLKMKEETDTWQL